jgi:hypothetical protein
VPFLIFFARLPAVSVNVAARLNLSDLRGRRARRALAVSLVRRVFPRFALREPRAFAINVFRRSPSAFASFRVTRTCTTAEHASLQVTLTGTRPLFTAFLRLRDASRTVPLGFVRSAIRPEGAESDEAERPARVAVTRDRSVEPRLLLIGSMWAVFAVLALVVIVTAAILAVVVALLDEDGDVGRRLRRAIPGLDDDAAA